MDKDFSPVSEYFSNLHPTFQFLILESFTALPLPDDLENMAIFYNVSTEQLFQLQKQIEMFLKELRSVWNESKVESID